MKVKLLTSIASPIRSAPAGVVIDMPEEEARPFLEGGYAVLVTEDAPVAGQESDGWGADADAVVQALKAELEAKDARIAELEAALATLQTPSGDDEGDPETATAPVAPESATAGPQKKRKK